ncbi:MAG: hypothetical protein AAF747_11060, partial [Planctomycetota bacterium]
MIRALLALFSSVAFAHASVLAAEHQPPDIRVAVVDLGDIRSDALVDGSHPRLRGAAEMLHRLRPNAVLLLGIAYDRPGVDGYVEADGPGANASRFVEHYLRTPQAAGLRAIDYETFVAPVNSGMPSGFDLDNDGSVTTEFPPIDPTQQSIDAPDSARRSDEAASYSGDAWGPGSFPGQRGMALLVDPRLEILRDQARTFQRLPWSFMPGAFLPEP